MKADAIVESKKEGRSEMKYLKIHIFQDKDNKPKGLTDKDKIAQTISDSQQTG